MWSDPAALNLRPQQPLHCSGSCNLCVFVCSLSALRKIKNKKSWNSDQHISNYPRDDSASTCLPDQEECSAEPSGSPADHVTDVIRALCQETPSSLRWAEELNSRRIKRGVIMSTEQESWLSQEQVRGKETNYFCCSGWSLENCQRHSSQECLHQESFKKKFTSIETQSDPFFFIVSARTGTSGDCTLTLCTVTMNYCKIFDLFMLAVENYNA